MRDGENLIIHLVGEDRLLVKSVGEPDRLVVLVGLGACAPQRIGAIEDDIACLRLEPGTLEQGAEPERPSTYRCSSSPRRNHAA